MPETLGLYVGSRADTYHGLEFCAVAAEAGVGVVVVCSGAAHRAVPRDVWLSVTGCGDVAVETEVTAGHFRSRGVKAVVATCFDQASDSKFLTRLAAGLPAVAIEPAGSERSEGLRTGAPAGPDPSFVTLSDTGAHAWGGYAPFAMDAFRFAVSRAQGLLRGRRVVVTAGGTREALDPVRFITNRSSGLMGHALAQAARDQGADVTLISSAARLPVPCGVSRAAFDDVASLREEVISATSGADVLIMAAAVSDYRPASVFAGKIKKSPNGLSLELKAIPNFIPEVPPGVLRVGFAAETDPDLGKAAGKLASRGFDMLCLNDVSRADAGFEVDTNALVILDQTGVRAETPLLPKTEIAGIVMEHSAELLAQRVGSQGEPGS